MGELIWIKPGSNTTGTRTIGKFVDWLKCVGQCFIYYQNGIIAAVQNNQNGVAIPGTLVRIDNGAEQFYSERRTIDNHFSTASKIIKDQFDAFKNNDNSPNLLNQNQPITIFNSSGQFIGNGSMWSTEQPGMLGGANFIRLNK